MRITTSTQLPFRLGPLALFGLLACLLVATEQVVVARADFDQHPALPAAVLADLLLVLPALFYVCVVRQYRLPLSTLVAVFGGGLALSHWLLPTQSMSVLAWAGRLGVALEVLTVSYALVKLRRIRRAYQEARQHSADFIDNLHTACKPVLGRLTNGLVTEVAIFRYALLGWGAPLEVRTSQERAFSTHQRSGVLALLAVAGLMSLVEAGAAHLVVAHWFPQAVWLLTILSLYGLLLLLAHGQAIRRRPVTVSAQRVVVRVGLAWRVAISREQLISIQLIKEAPASHPDCLNSARLLLTTPNLLLTLAEPQAVRGPYGVRRSVRQLAIYVDEPIAFQQALAE